MRRHCGKANVDSLDSIEDWQGRLLCDPVRHPDDGGTANHDGFGSLRFKLPTGVEYGGVFRLWRQIVRGTTDLGTRRFDMRGPAGNNARLCHSEPPSWDRPGTPVTT